MSAQGAVATDASEGTTTETQTTERRESPVLQQILREQGFADGAIPPASEETPAAGANGTEAETTTTAEPGAPAGEEGEVTEPTVPQPGEEHPVPEQWPQSAKARVKEEAEKRRTEKRLRETAEKERDELKQELETARGRVQTVLAPTDQDPLADVLNTADLDGKIRMWTELRNFAEDNPNGATGVVLGQDANGQQIVKDYSADDIKLLKNNARYVLDTAVPAKREWIAKAKPLGEEARAEYPEMFKDGTPENLAAAEILTVFPEVRRLPDYLLRIGDAVTGKTSREAKKAGKTVGKAMSAEARKIVEQPKVVPAPGAARTRVVERPIAAPEVVNTKKATEDFLDAGADEFALERMVSSRLKAKRPGGVEKVLA